MIVGEDSGESFRELIARVPCETIVTAINLDRWKKARRRDLKWMELHRN